MTKGRLHHCQSDCIFIMSHGLLSCLILPDAPAGANFNVTIEQEKHDFYHDLLQSEWKSAWWSI